MKKEIICVICPSGCKIQVDEGNEGTLEISGNRCKRGKEYAANEFVCPMRTLTSTVAVKSGEKEVIPVRTSCPVPKDKIEDCMSVITSLQIEAPISIYQIIVSKIAETDADLVATTSVERT